MDFSMNTAPATVTQTVTLELIDPTGAATPINAELRYDARDPYAVTTVFMTGTTQVRWTFGRELLTDGLYEPAGDGDVHVWPCLSANGEAVVIVELCSPVGETLLQFPSRAVQEFVYSSLDAVPMGTEQIDVDAWLDQLLAS